MAETIYDDEDYDDEFGNESCYNCGGRRYIVTCIDDLCHGQDECIHGDEPTPCPVCNANGERMENF